LERDIFIFLDFLLGLFTLMLNKGILDILTRHFIRLFMIVLLHLRLEN